MEQGNNVGLIPAAHFGLGAYCLLGVRRKVSETMPMAQCSPTEQTVALGLLGVHRQENRVDYHCDTQRYL